jgi:hypothetical protein
MPGAPERAAHDYVRAGTATLFAALEGATGNVALVRARSLLLAEFCELSELEMPLVDTLDTVCQVCTHECRRRRTSARGEARSTHEDP